MSSYIDSLFPASATPSSRRVVKARRNASGRSDSDCTGGGWAMLSRTGRGGFDHHGGTNHNGFVERVWSMSIEAE